MEASNLLLGSPVRDTHDDSHFVVDSDGDADTGSQRSISLDSPAPSPRHSLAQTGPLSPPVSRVSQPVTLATTDADSQSVRDSASLFTADMTRHSTMSSLSDEAIGGPPSKPEENVIENSTYPPRPGLGMRESSARESVVSFASGSSGKKARPESMLAEVKGPLMLGIALIDFNHLVRWASSA
jgi:hypothetical protein